MFSMFGLVFLHNSNKALAYIQKTYSTGTYAGGETLVQTQFFAKVSYLDNGIVSIDSISVQVNVTKGFVCELHSAGFDYYVSDWGSKVTAKHVNGYPDTTDLISGSSKTLTLYSAKPGHGVLVHGGESAILFGVDLTSILLLPSTDINWATMEPEIVLPCGGDPKTDTVAVLSKEAMYDWPDDFVLNIPSGDLTSQTSSIVAVQPAPAPTTQAVPYPPVTPVSTSTTANTQAPDPPSCQTASNGVTVYADPNFQGNCKFYGVGQYTSLVSDGFDSNISSFRVGSGVTFFVNTGQNFSGNPGVFNADVSDASRVGFNDDIRSLKVENVSSPSSQVTGDGIELCEGTNFGGHCDLFTEGSHDFSNTGWRDHIVSVKFLGNYVGNYHVTLVAENGGKYEADSDVSDLGDYYRDHIVSVNIVRKAPAKAELVSPIDGQTFDANTTEVVLIFKGPAPFRLHVFSLAAGYDRFENAWNDTSYHLTDLKPGFTYTWQVSANTGDWVSPRTFSIASSQPTPTPVPTDTPTPAPTDTPTPDNSTRPNGSSVQDSPACGSTLPEGQTSVELIFEGQAPFRIHVWDPQTGWDDWKENWTDTTLTESDLEKGHTYNWQVSANVGDFGPVCTFTVHE